MTPRECRYVIGIPSVERRRGYLAETVDSVVNAMDADELERARIIVFNGDVPAGGNREISATLKQQAALAASGTLMVVNRAREVEVGPCTRQERWKRQQVLDCVALLECCQELGQYYLHLEDDVVAARGFRGAIEARVKQHQSARRNWTILSFYNSFPITDGTCYSEYRLSRRYFGMIGQLLRTEDLPSLSAYLCNHYADAPVDSLLGRWALAAGGAVIGHSPALFQHVGIISSFENEIQIWDTPQFPERPEERRRRLQAALRDVKAHHPGSASDFLRYRAQLRAARK